jgi:hypothetical protein
MPEEEVSRLHSEINITLGDNKEVTIKTLRLQCNGEHSARYLSPDFSA